MIARTRTRRIIGFVFCAELISGLLSLGSAEQSDVFYDWHDEGFRKIIYVGEKYIASPDPFDEESECKGFNVCVSWRFRTSSDAALVIDGKGHMEADYREWISRYGHDLRRGALRAKRIIRIGPNRVEETLEQQKVSRRVLKGSDPARFSIRGVTCEVLDLAGHRLPRPIRADGLNPLIVTAWLRASALPSESDAKAISRDLQRRLNHSYLSISIRTDSWFIEDPFFPVWFPFATDGPPDYSEYRLRGEALCTTSEKDVSCAVRR